MKTNFAPQPKYDTVGAQTNNIQHSTVFCVLIPTKSINYAPQLLLATVGAQIHNIQNILCFNRIMAKRAPVPASTREKILSSIL